MGFANTGIVGQYPALLPPSLRAQQSLAQVTRELDDAAEGRCDALAQAHEADDLARRAEEVDAALRRHFPRWLLAGIDLPTSFRLNVAGEDEAADRFETRCRTRSSRDWLREELSGIASTDHVLLVIGAPPALLQRARESYLATLAIQYADAEAMGLARAGWTAEDVEAWTGTRHD
jgi:hypothetical protein